jgi:hypothetical protein
MKQKILIAFAILFVTCFFLFANASAECVVQGWAKNWTGSYVGANITGFCETAGETINLYKNPGAGYSFSWGDSGDSCQSYCDNVWINASNASLAITGNPYNETILVFYYPMNSSTTSQWSTINSHLINITLHGDVIAPTITILSPTSLFYYNTQSIWFNVTTSETADWCGYSLDGASNVTMTNSSGTWNDLDSSVAEGTRSVQFYCNDSSGNVGTTGPRTFYVDITNPTAYFGTNPADGSTQVSSTIVFDAKCTDNMGLSHLQIWSNKTGSWALTTSQVPPTNNTWYNLSTSGWSDGYYQWGVRCNDSATNSDWTDTNRTFSILTLTMDVTIISPTAGFYYDINDIWFNVSTSQTASWCGYSLDGATNVSLGGSGTFWYTLNDSMTEGSHSVIAYCNNSGGTVFTDGPLTFYVDLTNPIAYKYAPANGSTWTSSNTVDFTLKCSDNLGPATLVIYGNWSGWGNKSTNSSPTNDSNWTTTITIANGIYVWGAYCVDHAGRTNITANNTFTVNYVAPGPGGGGGGGGCTTYPGKILLNLASTVWQNNKNYYGLITLFDQFNNSLEIQPTIKLLDINNKEYPIAIYLANVSKGGYNVTFSVLNVSKGTYYLNITSLSCGYNKTITQQIEIVDNICNEPNLCDKIATKTSTEQNYIVIIAGLAFIILIVIIVLIFSRKKT